MRPQADPNITPLIDVLLVLLIIFMAALPLTQRGLDLSVPRETAPPRRDEPSPAIVLEYSADRQLRLNQQPLALEELGSRLREVFRGRHDRTLYLAGDGALRYGEVIRVIDVAKGAGVERVGVITAAMRAAPR